MSIFIRRLLADLSSMSHSRNNATTLPIGIWLGTGSHRRRASRWSENYWCASKAENGSDRDATAAVFRYTESNFVAMSYYALISKSFIAC